MDLLENEFDLLKKIEKNNGIDGELQPDLKQILNDLKNKEYIDDSFHITKKGIEALEPYRVKRAIFLAAGLGSRMLPITLECPKPMVKVNGKPIIENLIEATLKAGIPEIVIVTGYLNTAFDSLLYKYSNIRIIKNDN